MLAGYASQSYLRATAGSTEKKYRQGEGEV